MSLRMRAPSSTLRASFASAPDTEGSACQTTQQDQVHRPQPECLPGQPMALASGKHKFNALSSVVVMQQCQ